MVIVCTKVYNIYIYNDTTTVITFLYAAIYSVL